MTVAGTNTSLLLTISSACRASASWSRVRNRMTMFVSIASIAPFRGCAQRPLDLRVAQPLAVMRKRSKNLLGFGCRKWPRGAQGYPIARFFDDEFLAGPPALAVADRLRQDDLPLGRD